MTTKPKPEKPRSLLSRLLGPDTLGVLFLSIAGRSIGKAMVARWRRGRERDAAEANDRKGAPGHDPETP